VLGLRATSFEHGTCTRRSPTSSALPNPLPPLRKEHEASRTRCYGTEISHDRSSIIACSQHLQRIQVSTFAEVSGCYIPKCSRLHFARLGRRSCSSDLDFCPQGGGWCRCGLEKLPTHTFDLPIATPLTWSYSCKSFTLRSVRLALASVRGSLGRCSEQWLLNRW
jgi:hypothetical protein